MLSILVLRSKPIDELHAILTKTEKNTYPANEAKYNEEIVYIFSLRARNSCIWSCMTLCSSIISWTDVLSSSKPSKVGLGVSENKNLIFNLKSNLVDKKKKSYAEFEIQHFKRL